MKPVEEALASRSFRRVVLPGIVLTIGFHPLLSGLLRRHAAIYGLTEGVVVIVAEVMFWGLIVSSAVNWVYYIYEGYRLRWITEVARPFNSRRLKSTESKLSELYLTYDTWSDDEREMASAFYEELRDYPLKVQQNGDVVHYVYRATRLGNIIATYEMYPETRYGVDGVFYWFHFLQWAPTSAKADFDELYDFAESLVLTSFAGAAVALVHLIACAGFLYAHSTGDAPIVLPVRGSESLALLLLGVAFCVLFYYLALPAHREAGKVFKALVDASLSNVTDFIDKTRTSIDSDRSSRAERAHWYLSDLRSS